VWPERVVFQPPFFNQHLGLLQGIENLIKLHSKTKAIELGAKILKMVSDKPDPLGEVTLRIVYDKPKGKPNGD
jgi:hypothetical protein